MEIQDLSVKKIHSGTREYWQAILAIFMAVSDYFGLILLLRLCQGCLLAGFPALATAYINEEFDLTCPDFRIG